jgi:D-alanyl-D-alanine carboxypeptidase
VAPTPAPPPPAGPPACRYDDLLTFHTGLGSWRITLLDTIYMLPSSYAPGDLVDSSAAGLNRGYPVRAIAVDDLAALVRDARAAGASLAVVSGYRSHAQQASTFQYWVDVAGYEAALRTSARAGHSEHQLGTTLDFTTAGGASPWEYADWATTREGAWMAANAWRYGFVMSYPRGSYAQTCYDYEPWHYRYVGRELAAQIRASGLTPRQVLWTLQ